MNVVDHLFEESKGLDKDLVIGNNEQVSYREIWRQITAIADFLNREIGENQKVLLISDNSVFFIAAYFGVMKSGNIVVPLNPATEPDTLAYIREKCQSKLCLTPKKFRTKLVLPDIERIDDETLRSEIFRSEGEIFLPNAQRFEPKRVAAIIFTSGSTALPKGVMISHSNIIANTDSIITYLELTKDDIIEVVLPFFYCYGLSLLHTHVKVGGSLVLNNSFLLFSTVISDLLKYKCTGFAGVPSHFQILLRKSESFTKTEFPHLRYVTQAGGKLPEPFIKEFVAAFPTVRFYVMYGQTEATARLSYLPPELLPEKMGSIGKGIPGVTLEVLNKDGEPVKPGEIGEIVARGENIMVGYLDDACETRKVLKDGKLRTGDLATVDSDGYISLVAREKEILKVGGERVSPKEIEAVIVSLPEVIDCSIVGIPDDVLGEAVKAFVVLSENAERKRSKEEIVAYCQKRLSRNKIPKEIQFVSKIPINSAGKRTKVELKRLQEAFKSGRSNDCPDF